MSSAKWRSFCLGLNVLTQGVGQGTLLRTVHDRSAVELWTTTLHGNSKIIDWQFIISVDLAWDLCDLIACLRNNNGVDHIYLDVRTQGSPGDAMSTLKYVVHSATSVILQITFNP